MERVERLPADSPRGPENPDVKLSDGLPGRGLGKGDQPGWSDLGHVPGELERISLGPAEYPALAEQGGDEMDDPLPGHGRVSDLTTTNSKEGNQAGKIHAP